MQWGALNAVVFLETNHRFKEDPEYWKLLERIAKGEATREDIDTINSRVITKTKILYMMYHIHVTLVLKTLKETQFLRIYSCNI